MKLETNQIEKVFFSIKRWEVPFYEFVGGGMSLNQLESVIYSWQELESILETENYLNLISYNFNNNQIIGEVKNYILNNILKDVSEYRCKLYVLIGRFYNTRLNYEIIAAKTLPELVTRIFKGETIEVDWQGVSNPACPVEFLSKVEEVSNEKNNCKSLLPVGAALIGFAHYGDIELYMDREGIVYFYLTITDQLFLGSTFLNSLEILFFGLEYGRALC